MTLAHIGNDTYGRFGNVRQFLNLAAAAHAHLDDAHAVLFRELKQCPGQAYFVVKIFSVCNTLYFCPSTVAMRERVDVFPADPVTATTGSIKRRR